MNLSNLSAILSTIGQLPVGVLLVITCVFGGIGIGIGMALRDIPKYFFKTIKAILNFILSLKGKEQIGVSPGFKKEENNSAINTFRIIEGGKSEKKENHHKDGHAN